MKTVEPSGVPSLVSQPSAEAALAYPKVPRRARPKVLVAIGGVAG